jgi:hypothetical protein
MIKSYLESIDNLDSILYDKKMLNEPVYVYKELECEQYFCAVFDYANKEFKDFTTSGDFKLGRIIKHFKLSYQPEFISKVVSANKKKKVF